MRTNAHSGEITQVELPSDQGPSASSAQLTVLVGPQVGHVFSLASPLVVIGRAREAGIRMPHTSVSRAHARIHRFEGGRYELEELGSSNGTWVNGEPLHGRCTLRSGDRIRFGPRVLLQFATVDQFDRRIREMEKLETVSQLSSAVNHDLNNLLSVLTCGIAYLATLGPNTRLGADDVVECLQDMRLAASKAGELTQRLNTLVRQPDRVVSERVNLSELSDEVARMVRRVLPEGVRLETTIEPSLAVEGNRAWLHQLLMNPCINARDALSEGGVLTIEARTAIASEVAEHPELEAIPHVLVSIADNGRGIPAEIVPRVFQPYFTTKGAGKGTGLGLATVARVAKEHGGAVYLTSKLGVGTCLRVFLPKSTTGALNTLLPVAPPWLPSVVRAASAPIAVQQLCLGQ